MFKATLFVIGSILFANAIVAPAAAASAPPVGEIIGPIPGGLPSCQPIMGPFNGATAIIWIALIIAACAVQDVSQVVALSA